MGCAPMHVDLPLLPDAEPRTRTGGAGQTPHRPTNCVERHRTVTKWTCQNLATTTTARKHPSSRAGSDGRHAGAPSLVCVSQQPVRRRRERTHEQVTYVPDPSRYEAASFRRCGASGLVLPPISLGLWQNFGDTRPLGDARAILRRAFDRGITHVDLANNYGPPYGAAEVNFGRVYREDFAPYRDELVVSTKAGYDMWPGPYGDGGSRKYLTASLDQSLRRTGLDYFDIFYSHRFDPETPLEETMSALASAVHQGKALYAGISSYSPERTAEAAAILRDLGSPLLIHQPSYSMLNRWVEGELLDVLAEQGVGCIAFSPLAQGLLSTKYIDGIPEYSRASEDHFLKKGSLTEQRLAQVRGLDRIARARGQSLAQMAIAWVLRDPRVTSALVGVRSVEQLDENLDALGHLDFSGEELGQIDHFASDAGINLWERSSSS